MPATPAIELLDAMGIAYRLYTYDHDPSVSSYGLEAAEALGTDGSVVLKTLIADLGTELAVGVVPVEDELDLRALAHHLGAKRATLARPGDAARSSGYVLGGISPLGQRRRLTTVIDQSVEDLPTVSSARVDAVLKSSSLQKTSQRPRTRPLRRFDDHAEPSRTEATSPCSEPVFATSSLSGSFSVLTTTLGPTRRTPGLRTACSEALVVDASRSRSDS